MPEDPWRPDVYERFAAERERPLCDLLAMLQGRGAASVVDLGCGTGAGTAWVHAALGARATLGVDTSEAMLSRTPRHVPGLSFAAGDMAAPPCAGPFDVVFSNAALHWLPDHARHLATWCSLLARDGRLAVQVPANHGHVSQTTAADVAAEEPFATALRGWTRTSPVREPDAYEGILADLGLRDVVVRAVVYPQRLPDADAVVTWMRGTTLTDYERRMSRDVFADFVARYAEVLAARLPPERPVPFDFRRILFTARRPA